VSDAASTAYDTWEEGGGERGNWELHRRERAQSILRHWPNTNLKELREIADI
jgi:hypothetical protein